ncbi:hypothetical protein AB0H43_03195 [Hamadaea sp. NPDC050747]|uniref:hypothetical protein n=1 Tax=Hamadaea sp. NPDC050747 TaxID=3155789 RepID=UPI0033C1912B
MTTITDLAREYNIEPEGLRVAVDMTDVEQTAPLTAEQEAFIRDVVENTDEDGVYHVPTA